LSSSIGIYGSVGIDLAKFRDVLKADGRPIKIHNETIFPHNVHVTDYIKNSLAMLRNSEVGGNKDSRIVAFIDDLDRCTPDNALELLESIKTFFDIEGIVYVIGMDSNSINSIVKKKYGYDFSRGFDYMQKIVQLHFEIPPWKGDDISDSVEQIIEKGLKGSEVLNEFKNTGKLIVKAVESNPRQLKRFINNVILAKAVSNELPIDGLIAVRALDFRREWNRFSELMTPDETRTMFLSEYKTLKARDITITNEEQLDKIAKGTSDSLLQDEDILEIYRELVKQGKALRDFLDSTSEVLEKIEKMGDFRRALDTTKLKPIEEQLEFYERLLKYLNKTQSLYSRSIKERIKMVQLVQQNHPKECSQIDSSNPDFAPIYWNMNNEELSMFNSLRQITQDISTYDSIMLMLLDKKSIYLEKIPVLRDLYDHLDSWLKQYKEIFHRPEVSLIYEYDKPFPPTIKELVERKIKELKLQI